MSDKKRSIFRWLRHPRFLKQKKTRERNIQNDPIILKSVQIEPLSQTNASVSSLLEAHMQPQVEDYPVLQPIRQNLPADEFDLFVQISNSPTSDLPTCPRDLGRKRSPDKRETQGRRLHFRSSPQHNDSSHGSLVNDDLRRVMSLIERKPSVPKPTSFRRDLARASFRSKSVRERGATKKLQYPWPGDPQQPTDENAHFNFQNEVPELESTDAVDQRFDSNLYRVRSFKLTRKGVINLGDTFRARSFIGLASHHTESHSHNGDVQYPFRHSSAGYNSTTHSPGIATALDKFHFHTPEHQTCEGYDYSRRSTLLNETDLAGRSKNGITDVEQEQPIRIQIVGFPNVGKTALCRQMITSEFLGARMESMSEDTVERYVTVELDDQTWNIVLIDNFGEAGADELALVNTIKSQEKSDSATDSPSILSTPHLLPHSKSSGSTLLKDVLVYLLVFAVDDARSYEYASKVLRLLSKSSSDRIIMLVANKVDLVRRRVVPAERGKRLAHLYGCKYFEVSTAINHLVDELLVAIILLNKQTQQNRTSPNRLEVPNATERRMSSLRLRGEAIVRYFRDKFDAKSCDDIKNP